MDDRKIAHLLANLGESLLTNLGIEFTELSPQLVVGTMPVDKRTRQPFGLLHGGASLALAETLASAGAWLNIDEEKEAAVGMEVNANHLRAVSEGLLTGRASPVHLGRKSQVWEIRIINQDDKLVCISRCTIAVVAQEEVGCVLPQ